MTFLDPRGQGLQCGRKEHSHRVAPQIYRKATATLVQLAALLSQPTQSINIHFKGFSGKTPQNQSRGSNFDVSLTSIYGFCHFCWCSEIGIAPNGRSVKTPNVQLYLVPQIIQGFTTQKDFRRSIKLFSVVRLVPARLVSLLFSRPFLIMSWVKSCPLLFSLTENRAQGNMFRNDNATTV